MRLQPTSFIIPCLNEAESLPRVIDAIESLRARFQDLEILIVDNGSDDHSASYARERGARVIECAERGYGVALRTGINAAAFENIVYADADGTYDLRESPRLIEALERSGGLVVGTRLRGTIWPGAMPSLHRRFGTPVLSLLISLLHGWWRRAHVSDCNSGMRAFRKSEFRQWRVRSTGMEFASELIVRALRSEAPYREIPIHYRRAAANRRSHLRPWSDGLAHARQILALSFTSRRAGDVSSSRIEPTSR